MSVAVSKMFSSTALSKLCGAVRTAFSDKYLFYTNVAISMSLSAAGDVIEQRYEIYKRTIDSWSPRRTANMTISGVTVGVFCHHWYTFLDRRLPGNSLRLVMKKVVLDQIFCSPVAIAIFFGTLGVLERTSTDELVAEIKEKSWKLYAAEWVLWPPAQFFNFYFLSTRHRILFDSAVSLVYDVYTSNVKHENLPRYES